MKNPPSKKLIDTIQLGPHKWEVYAVSDHTLMPDAEGLTFMQHRQILIRVDADPDKDYSEVYIHELLHAGLYSFGVGHWLKTAGVDEETLIQLITPMVLCVFRAAGLMKEIK